MWARVCELMLGVWLMLSPFIFRGTDELEQLFWIHLGAGAAVVIFSLLSFWRPAGWAHFLTAALAVGLGTFAYFAFDRPGPPAAQNAIAVALLLMMFAIVPNEATLPPESWRDPR